MVVNFNIFKNAVSWNAIIHQLNGDILLRHVLMKGNVDNLDINFSYCEESGEGKITNSDDTLIGNFLVSF
ncbi:hypothetical protein [Photobacterium nomapromontoriensis]|uniref:hypothetical protein n=1 Tax=Photobacterium nomapromontoriensis TaxID=2910237 RepID=UPI003D0AD64D